MAATALLNGPQAAFIAYASGITGDSNPGPISIAYLLVAPDGKELCKELVDTAINGSGHDAEYLSVMHLSRAITSCFDNITNLSVYSSSKLLVNQLSGRWAIRVQRHQTFVDKITSHFSNINWDVTWIPRIENPMKTWHWEYHSYSKDDSKGIHRDSSQKLMNRLSGGITSS